MRRLSDDSSVNGPAPVPPCPTAGMFARIAPRYDLGNRLLSLFRDRAWRRDAAAMARVPAPRLLLDIAAGSGDFAAAFIARHPGLRTLLLDPCEPMLARAVAKGVAGIPVAAQAEALPLPAGCADLACCAFGVRNFADPGRALAECARALRPGGELILLEFALPRAGPLRRLIAFMLARFVPLAGRLISGDAAAYRYLAASIPRFDAHADLPGFARRAGLKPAGRSAMFLGLVVALRFVRP